VSFHVYSQISEVMRNSLKAYIYVPAAPTFHVGTRSIETYFEYVDEWLRPAVDSMWSCSDL
jgi:hypothetical protein